MPIYDWICDDCELEFESVQTMKEYDGNWTCPKCSKPGRRNYRRCKFHFTGTKIEDAEFNPGLGRITKSKRHREELAKKMGAIEIGNENPDSLHKHFDTSREEKLKKSWDEV
jgi:putative FmdB family regulatory protein